LSTHTCLHIPTHVHTNAHNHTRTHAKTPMRTEASHATKDPKLGQAASLAHTKAAALLCQALSSHGAIAELVPRDSIRALWAVSVIGIMEVSQN